MYSGDGSEHGPARVHDVEEALRALVCMCVWMCVCIQGSWPQGAGPFSYCYCLSLFMFIYCWYVCMYVCTVSFHNFKSQNDKLRVSNPKSKYVAYLSVLSRISIARV